MGCGSSAATKVSPTGAGDGDVEPGSRKLLEEYHLGETLGEGAFGVVRDCINISSGEHFAVKMIPKVDNPVETIKKEVDMLQSINHPNVVKFHDVYWERCFVCIVMDKHSGGDLVEGLQKHLKERGQIDCFHVIHTVQQMGSGINFLHSRLIVHRDVKGDNYLMDRPDIVDPKCQIVLTDFGTAVQIQADERLSQGVGTKIFWPPEFYDRDYSFKVDVWAMGVILYGLVTGRFPFKDQNDIRTKEIKVPRRVHPYCEDLIKTMLYKSEEQRLSAEQVLSHKWLVGNGVKNTTPSNDTKEDEEDSSERGANLRESNANDGVKERRQELLNRMNREQEAVAKKGKKAKPQHYLQNKFLLADGMISGAKFVYEWWEREKVDKVGLLDIENQAKKVEAKSSQADDLQLFKQMLEDHDINPEVFGQGKAKTLGQLAAEVVSGACRLMLDATCHKKLVRVVDVVVFRLLSPEGAGKSRLLIETEECFPDGRKRETVRLPGTKKEPHENSKQTAERILKDMLNMSTDSIKFDLSSIVRYEEETESPSYPGVRTVYRKEIVEAVVSTKDQATLTSVGLPSFSSWSATGKDGNTKTFNWMTEESARAKKIKFKAEGAEVVSTLVRPPIGLNEEQLRAQLLGSGIDVSKYGHSGKTKTLKDFSAELVRGEATLVKGPDGHLLRVVDVVLLIIQSARGEILVQAAHEKKDGHRTTLNRLPGAKCRPDENQFLGARRILRRQLEMDENDAKLTQDVRVVEEEKPTDFYPGLKTIYRKRVIKAEMSVSPGKD